MVALLVGFCQFSLRKLQVWHMFCFSCVLLSVDCNTGKASNKGNHTAGDKIKRKQPDDPFLPAMIVFSLDHTLWPFTMEYMQPPLIATTIAHQIKDNVGRLFNLFPEVPSILDELDRNWYKIGGISDNSDIRTVEKTTDLFNIDQFFNGFEAKPGNKTEQMKRLSERAKVPLENILYFDTNQYDLDYMKGMNVTTVLLHPFGGLTYAHLERGFNVFKDEKENANVTASTTVKPTHMHESYY